MKTQRQWSDRAIARTTPLILAPYSIVALTAKQVVRLGSLMTRHVAWYTTDISTFSDTIALVRARYGVKDFTAGRLAWTT
jgi:hypothetical protein